MPVYERRVPGSAPIELHAVDWTRADAKAELAPVLLVHGLASNARLWDGVGAALAERGHRVVAIDQRGHGLSDKPDDGYDFTTITDDLLAVLDGLSWDQAVVAGQSWGGNVAVELAWRSPDRVLAMAAVDGGFIELSSHFPIWEDCEKALRPPAMAGLAASTMEGYMRQSHPDWPETGITGAMACFEIGPDGTVKPWLTLARHLQILRALWEHRPHDRLAELAVEALLIPADGGPVDWSRDKRAAVAQAEASNPRVTATWVTGDHDLHAQHPVVIADLLHGLAQGAAS
jgi:pimeloyl-ACP methyl ester carboxylesterase